MRLPNILLICADQLRPFELGCHGHPVVRTPRIDALAAQGVRFEFAVTPNPLCTPARSSLLSGQYSRTCTGMLGCVGEPVAHRRGFPDPSLPERLAAIGYETALTGKWHVGSRPSVLGFQDACHPAVPHLNANQTYFDGSGRSWMQPGFAPDFELERSAGFFSRARLQPFFLFHNISLPHMPFFDVPAAYRTRYRPEQTVLRPNTVLNGKEYFDEHAFLVYLYDYLYYREKKPECSALPAGYDLRALTADYYGMIASVDEQVGRLLDALDRSGQADETIVVFTADHGDNLGSHHRWNKHSLNDEAIRIPLLVRWPKRLQPHVVSGHVASLVDLAPTLLGLMEQAVPGGMQGRDLSTVLTGQTECIGQGEAMIENIGGEIGVRTPTHLFATLTEAQPGSPERKEKIPRYLFHDTVADPYQMANLAATSAGRETADNLYECVRRWDRATPWLAGSMGGTYGQG